MKALRHLIPLAVVSLLTTVTLGAEAPEPSPQPRLENLLRQALDQEFTPGREIIVSMVEIPPHSSVERHWHPGEEFHYYLEGEVEISIDGQEPIRGIPGTVGHIPYKKLHTATTGESGAKVLVFRIHEEGQPVRVSESGESSQK